MDERDPVDDGESVLRRIHRSFVDPNSPIPIQFPAFRPNPNDTNGLSFFRAGICSPVEALASIDPAKAGDYFVARLAVAALRNLGLSINPDPVQGGPAGHCVMPELNWDAYQADKPKWKPIIVELARLASANIVHRPN